MDSKKPTTGAGFFGSKMNSEQQKQAPGLFGSKKQQ